MADVVNRCQEPANAEEYLEAQLPVSMDATWTAQDGRTSTRPLQGHSGRDALQRFIHDTQEPEQLSSGVDMAEPRAAPSQLAWVICFWFPYQVDISFASVVQVDSRKTESHSHKW